MQETVLDWLMTDFLHSIRSWRRDIIEVRASTLPNLSSLQIVHKNVS
jgi:hypothetical protein